MTDLKKPERLIALDVFRGITIAGMILVNNPGSWRDIYPPLRHAHWHGWTPTDLVFPFFLFIVGVAMAYSFRGRLARGDSRAALFTQVVRRSVMIFLVGMILNSWGLLLKDAVNWPLFTAYAIALVATDLLFSAKGAAMNLRRILGAIGLVVAVVVFIMGYDRFVETQQRIPGVLQRIAVCYFFASIVVLLVGIRGQAVAAVLLTVAYVLIIKLAAAPPEYTAKVTGPEGLLHDWVDTRVFGQHLYSWERPEPEGIIGTLTSIATVLIGVLTGHWMQRGVDKTAKLAGLFVAANALLLGGLVLDAYDPINKKIWSSSYVLFTAGMALHFLGMCFWLVDIRQRRRWAVPFLVLGSNAIVAYAASSMGATVLGRIELTAADGGSISLKVWLLDHLFAGWLSPANASLAYALAYVAVWILLLMPLYLRRIFIRI